jgi:sialate O-acetylesterase
VCYGPTYDFSKVEGNKIRVSFKNIGSGLVLDSAPVLPGKEKAPQPAKLTGFEIAGDDKKWVEAEAVIEGSDVVVSSAPVPAPVAVRYCWSDFPACSLYNKEGLPAYPFRSDSWE